MHIPVDAIAKRIVKAVEEKIFPACAVGTVERNGGRTVVPFGHFTYDADSPPVRENSIFDVASVTKAIPVSCIALQLIEEGKLKLNDPVTSFVPEFAGEGKNAVTVFHLLTQTLDLLLPHLSSLRDVPPRELLTQILQAPLRSRPGTKFVYANATSILLGLVVERVSGRKLDELARERFFEPLGMSRTGFHPEGEVIPTEVDERRGLIQGTVHDESAFVLSSIMTPGSAGLFSTAPDLLTFLEMLLREGEFSGRRYFKPETVTLMHTNQLANIGASHGLGWELNQRQYMGNICSDQAFGKTGFTGCVAMCDPVKGVGFVMLSNCTFPKRRAREEQVHFVNEVRRDVASIIFGDITN
jgi:CubicO group peptidase (beta-lactamase class C family)